MEIIGWLLVIIGAICIVKALRDLSKLEDLPQRYPGDLPTGLFSLFLNGLKAVPSV